MNNLVFISGPQGAGKSTLLEAIKNKDVLVPKLKTLTPSLFEGSPQERRPLKICQRALENFEYLSIARKNPEKIVLGDRCIYCIYAFGEVYARRGWISHSENEFYNLLASKMFLPELLNPSAIVLNPGFDAVWRHLENRWKTHEKKWREDDREYIKYACESYEVYRDNSKVLYIDHVIDMSIGSDAAEIYSWLERTTGISLSLHAELLGAV